jgi:hypothetical protein
MSDTAAESVSAPPTTRSRTRLLHRLALAHVLLVILAVIIALPLAVGSMATTLTDRQARTLYDFPAGTPTAEDAASALANGETFLNIAAIDIDEAEGSVTIGIHGHRRCDGACPPMTLTLYSVEDDADVRRALPPSATLTLQPDDDVFTQTVQLPIRGQPSQYPFDDYVLWLGLTGTVTENGVRAPLTPESLHGRVIITTQNQLRDFLMAPPAAIDPDRVHAITDPGEFIGVQEMRVTRPFYLEVLTLLLVVLIAASAIMAVLMRDMTDLLLGMGSLILGIWGVRSVLVPRMMQVVTSVDLALSIIILFVLLGLTVRAAQHFRVHSELPSLTERWRR